jgi:hypothetical protein
MRRYLSHHNQLPASESLVAMCPVSVRPSEAMKDCGNLISAMFIGIGTDIGEPLERLSAVRRRTARGVPLARDVLCDLNNAVGDMMPPYVRALGAWLQNKSRLASTVPLVNTLITNVPGIPGLVQRYFAGARIVNVFPLAPVSDGMGISHCLTGIYDDLNVGVLADRNIVSDMDFYISCIQASTDEYRALLSELEKSAAASAPARVEAPKPATNEQSAVEPEATTKPQLAAGGRTKAAAKTSEAKSGKSAGVA